jgi:hypothetical protein
MSIITNLSTYYKLDGNPYASFGTNNGTNNGGVTYGTGIISQSGVFNATNAFVNISSSADFTYGNGDFGISVWFKRANSSTSRQTICGDCNSFGVHNTATIQLLLFNNYITCYFFSGGSVYPVTDTTTITDTNWHHIIYTRNGNTLYLYVDGVFKSSFSLSPGISCNASSTKMSLGSLGESNSFYFGGSIDEIGFWKQSLLPYISDLYNSGTGLTYPFYTPSGNISYLVVGGGGAGGNSYGGTSGGGGGGGGLLSGSINIDPGVYSVIVGAGGTSQGASPGHYSSNGSSSIFNNIKAIGGGAGGYYLFTGSLGASGGGGNGDGYSTPGSGSLGQGNKGGIGNNSPYTAAGGGGGYSSTGSAYNGFNGGDGGSGSLSSITGIPKYYSAGGGGGGSGTIYPQGIGGIGGSGIGGNGGNSNIPPALNPAGFSGSVNTGAGGGGASPYSNNNGGAGGSGIVVIRYLTSDFALFTVTGGAITTDGVYTIHTFTSNGIFSIYASNFFLLF